MVNHNQATVTEFMLCTWPQIRMVRLFLQLIEKMDQPQNVPPTELPQNIESSPQPPTPHPPPTPTTTTEISENIPPITISC